MMKSTKQKFNMKKILLATAMLSAVMGTNIVYMATPAYAGVTVEGDFAVSTSNISIGYYKGFGLGANEDLGRLQVTHGISSSTYDSISYTWYRDTEPGDVSKSTGIPDTAEEITNDNYDKSIYKLTEEDRGHYIFVKIVVSDYRSSSTIYAKMDEKIGETDITSVDVETDYTGDRDKNGIGKVGNILTAKVNGYGYNEISSQDVTYQWYRTKVGGTLGFAAKTEEEVASFDTKISPNMEAITGATSSTYTLTTDDIGYYLSVVVKGTGNTVGAAMSSTVSNSYTTGNVSRLLVTYDITGQKLDGTYKVGQTLTMTTDCDDLAGDNLQYIWYRSDSPTTPSSTSGTSSYIISGANSKTYTITNDDIGYYIHGVVYGKSGSGFIPEITNASILYGEMVDGTILNSATITGTPKVNEQLTLSIDPESAETSDDVTIEWYRSSNNNANISGDTYIGEGLTFTPYTGLEGYYIKAKVTGQNNVRGTVVAVTDEVVAEADEVEVKEITSASMKCSSYTLQVGSKLTVNVEPADAEYTVTWSKISGPYNNTTGPQIDVGNNTNTLTVTEDLLGYYIVAKVEGVNGWTGSRIVRTTDPVKVEVYCSWADNCNKDVKVGDTLNINITPDGSTYDLKWYKSENRDNNDSTNHEITSNDGNTSLKVTDDMVGYYIRAKLTGTGNYGGTWTLFSDQVQEADEPEQPDDTPSVNPGERIPTSDESVEYVTIDTDDVYNGYNQGVKVYVSQGQDIAIRLPFKTVLDGTKGNENKADFEVEVRANISGADNIKVIPETEFTMSATGKKPINGTVEIDQTEYNIAKDGEDSLSTGKVVAGKVSVENLSAGHWEGDFDWEISIEGLQVADSGENTENTEVTV